MTVTQSILCVLTALGFLYWLVQLWIVVRVVRSVPLLKHLPCEEAASYPRISVIMTACNEALSLQQAMQHRLQEDYPNLEFIIVEDRSTDETPALADRIAASDKRVSVVHITSLPQGWLGKLNALHEGTTAASGEWLLLSDADVSVKRGALARAMGYCQRKNLDHLVVLPEAYSVNPLLDALTSVFMRLVVLNMRIWSIENPSSKASVGAGAFNLVKRSALDKTGGFEWLKMEVADDLALGQMLKRSGARQSVLNGKTMAGLYFHRSVAEALGSAERATYTAIGNFSMLRLLILATVVLVLEYSPVMAFFCGLVPGLFLTALALTVSIIVNRWLGRAIAPLLLLPFAQALVFYSQVRAGILGKLRRGIIWRGSYYPEAVLKAGKRIQL